jgi:hypothetical protein
MKSRKDVGQVTNSEANIPPEGLEFNGLVTQEEILTIRFLHKHNIMPDVLPTPQLVGDLALLEC